MTDQPDRQDGDGLLPLDGTKLRNLASNIDLLQDSRQLRRHTAIILRQYADVLDSATPQPAPDAMLEALEAARPYVARQADYESGLDHDADTICAANTLKQIDAALAALVLPADGATIPLADHNEIGRKVFNQPWKIQSAIITITAHCTVLTDKHPTGEVADLAGCISQCCSELANGLSRQSPRSSSEDT